MDVEKLIELVRENPVLYKTTDPHYMRTKLKEYVWGKIGLETNSNDLDLVQRRLHMIRQCLFECTPHKYYNAIGKRYNTKATGPYILQDISIPMRHQYLKEITALPVANAAIMFSES